MKPRAAAAAGWFMVGATAIVVVATMLRWATASTTLPWTILALLTSIPLAFSLVGALIVSKRPDNGLGWLFVVGGTLTAVTGLTQVVGDAALTGDPDDFTGRLVAWATDVLNPLSLSLITVFLFLLFPSGRLTSRSARRVAAVTALGIALAMGGALVEPTLQEHAGVASPLTLGTPAWLASTLSAAGFVLIGLGLVASIVLLVRKLRRAIGRERDQLRLLVWAAAVATLLVAPALALPGGVPDQVRNLAYLFGGLGLLLIPVSVGVAILRHGLLDIDLVIRRTVVAASMGAFVTVVYVGIVVGVGAIVGSRASVVLSAVAAAVVAIAFQPVRGRARRLANRLVYGERATPYEVMHEFSERVAGSYRTQDVLPRMATILGEGTGAERAQVWLRVGTELQPAAVWPRGMSASTPVSAPAGSLPALTDVTHAVAVRDEGQLLGALSITRSAADPPSPAEERLIADLALQAGLVLRNVQLVEDLRASRQRLVSAQDRERRRIERDIHDGAQQQLVALAVKARLVDAMVERDAEAARRLAREIQAETQEALESLRELARGIYPPLLADRGLAVALEAQGRKSPVDVRVLADGVGRHPQEVEAAAYFCCLEAIQNVAKYARASRVEVEIESRDGDLTFTIRDDGAGFDPETTARGSGLQNMADRLAALDGTLDIRSSPGEGTSVAGRIPVGTTRRPGAPSNAD